ncbi:MAG: hypothetical protein KGI06_04295 [Candidatus Micrarchaeota archaeon]|nr:hypothetical protein [Candidatus Micrarchaeota archaeon]
MDVIYKLPRLQDGKVKESALTEQQALSMIRPHIRAREDKRMLIDVLNDIKRMIGEGDLKSAEMRMRERRLSHKEVRSSASDGLACLVERCDLGKARLVPNAFCLPESLVARSISKGATKLVVLAAGEIQESNHDGAKNAERLIATVADATRMFGFNDHKRAECVSSGLVRYLESMKSDRDSRATCTDACIGVMLIVRDSGNFGLSGDGIKEMSSKVVSNLMKSGLSGDAARVATKFLSYEDLQSIVKKVPQSMQAYGYGSIRRKHREHTRAGEAPADLRK